VRDPRERLRVIQEHVRNNRYFPTINAERRWTEECKYAWAEFEEWVARLRPEHCLEICPSNHEDFPDEIVDTYAIPTGTVRKGRPRAVWIEFVIFEDYVKVVSAHRTKLKKDE
jgi:hypothetical protein